VNLLLDTHVFDRMLLAQCRVEGVTLVSIDAAFGEFDDFILR
jgi:PIN domain nuclease of toxin-antitoxin system